MRQKIRRLTKKKRTKETRDCIRDLLMMFGEDRETDRDDRRPMI